MFRYAIRGLKHYARINFVVMAAVAISTAAIAGSLIVGDSVRHSLRKLTEERLGQIQFALHSPQFFTEELFQQLKADQEELKMAPAIFVTGACEAKYENTLRKAGQVNVLGLDASGWDMLNCGQVGLPADGHVVLGFRTAEELKASVGGQVSVWVEVPESIPRDSLLGERDDVTVEIVLTVSGILSETDGASRFDLNPGQQLPHVAYLSLSTLQSRLGLDALEVSRRNPIARPARLNTIFAAEGSTANALRANGLSQEFADLTQQRLHQLTDALQKHVSLTDVGLKIQQPNNDAYLSVESDSMILPDTAVDAITQACQRLHWPAAPTLVYLVNEVSASDRKKDDRRYSMYSIFAGLPFDRPAPLGPIGDEQIQQAVNNNPNGVVLSAWLAADLQVEVGDSVATRWHPVGSHGDQPEIENTFSVVGILPDDDSLSIDRSLTPNVAGITDVDSFDEWDQPFDMEMDRITGRDDQYWEEHRATPKAFFSLPTAEKFWQSRFGKYTSIRVGVPATTERVTQLQSAIQEAILPQDFGIGFRPVLLQGLRASVGANDFTGLFVGFSSFLILSAIILAGLMFRLGLQSRIQQYGLLAAVGWTQQRRRNLFLTEGLLVSACGTIVGCLVGILFAKLMIYGLTTWWIGAVGTRFLMLHFEPSRLVIAAIVSLTLAAIVIVRTLASVRHIDVRNQLSGVSNTEDLVARGRWQKMVNFVSVGSIVVSVVIPLIVMAGLLPEGVAFEGITWPMVAFFLCGFGSLLAGLSLLRWVLIRRQKSQQSSVAMTSLNRLALANAARNPSRSLLTTALIAFATFVIVAVGAGRRNPLSETPDRSSGNGGFRVVAETAQSVIGSLNNKDDLLRLGCDAESLPKDIRMYGFGVRPGTDASCVNLYQATVPTILGASSEFIERGGFRFSNSQRENPWEMLTTQMEPTVVNGQTVPTLPVIGDANTLQYSLKKRTGASIFVPNDQNPEFALKVVGMLDGSVFQGVLIADDRQLKQIDRTVSGQRYFLMEAQSSESADKAVTIFETGLNDHGFDAESVSQRIAGFLAVQNTYLSTFQLLGGLGLLVGTFGLAAVMVRNVLERRKELALLRAVGFTSKRIATLILAENNLLLVWGIAAGCGSALLAMLPHIRSTGGDLPLQSLFVTLLLVLLTGSLAALLAVKSATSVSVKENLTAD